MFHFCEENNWISQCLCSSAAFSSYTEAQNSLKIDFFLHLFRKIKCKDIPVLQEFLFFFGPVSSALIFCPVLAGTPQSGSSPFETVWYGSLFEMSSAKAISSSLDDSEYLMHMQQYAHHDMADHNCMHIFMIF